MKPPRNATPVFILDGVLYIFCLLGIWQIAEKTALPLSLFRSPEGTFVVSRSTGRLPSGLSVGDTVSLVDGKKISIPEDIEFLLDGIRVGNDIPVTVRSTGRSREVVLTGVPAYSKMYVLIAWFVGTLFFFSGVFVFVKKRSEIAAVVYHYGAVGVASIIMMTWGCYAINPTGLGHAIRIIFSFAYAFVPALLLHLSLVFPTKKETSVRVLVKPLYVLTSLLSIGMAVTFLKATFPVSVEEFHTFMFFFNVTRWVYAMSVFLAIFFFALSYRSARQEMERRQLRWVFLGLIISSLGFVSLWQVPELLTSYGLVSEEVVILVSAATPIAFAVAIIKYHVMDIDYFVNRSSVYVIVLIILFSIYALVVGSVAAVVASFTVTRSILVSAVAAAIVAILFQPVRVRVQRFVDRNFFRVKYDMKLIDRKFDDEIWKCATVEEIGTLLIKNVVAAIPVERIGFFAIDEPGYLLRSIFNEGLDPEILKTCTVELQDITSRLSVPLILKQEVEPGVRYEEADEQVFLRLNAAAVLPMRSEKGDVSGLLILGPKKSGNLFSIEDVELLTSLMRQSGLAYGRILMRSRLRREQEERERLEELNRMKTYFVSSVSHDLKTPLTTIRMYTEILKSRGGSHASKTEKYLDTIWGESLRLTRLIDNVLDVAKAERGTVSFALGTEDLNEIVAASVEMMEYELKKEGFACKVKIRSHLQPISANRDAVIEALGNLISNAIEYSTKKKIIRIETFKRGESVCVSVIDRGVGIAREDLPHVFDAFYRGAATKTLRPGGTGLGLAVVKNVMDAHHGSVNIDSEPGYGTRITLLFPITERS